MKPKLEHPAVFKPLLLDLNDLNSVRTAASEFAVQENRLDILWNNAGIGADSVPVQSKTAQGLEKFVGMHCVAALLFTQLLLPQLQHAAKSSLPGAVRVVWLSSIMAESHVPADGIDFNLLAAGVSTFWIQFYPPSRSKFCQMWPVPQMTYHTAGFETGYAHIVTLSSTNLYETTPLVL
jgi:NAD(P)-dependent dehydrogenase (short-subunit alcohol dehydrogenase family)